MDVKQRKILSELLEKAAAEWDAYLDDCRAEEMEPEVTYYDFLANRISENGVIVLPCKIGETVYHIVEACPGGIWTCPYSGGYGMDRCNKHPCGAYIEELKFNLKMLPWDKNSYFLTREKAEAKLKKMKEEDNG